MYNIERPGGLYQVTGCLLLVMAMVADVLLGLHSLARSMPLLLFWHIPIVLIWTLGIVQIERGQTLTETGATATIHRQAVTRALAALTLGLCTFPGIGCCAYSLALLIRYGLRQSKQTTEEEESASGQRRQAPVADVQPLIEILQADDLERQRAAIAALAEDGTPEHVQLLRQFLTAPQPELRAEAALAITRLDERLAAEVDHAFACWEEDPENSERILALVASYYAYAASNVLDRSSQRFYLLKARDLLLQGLTEERMQAEQWVQLARIHHRLGERKEALHDAYRALHLQPDSIEAYIVALEQAFYLREWHTILTLEQQQKRIITEVPQEQAIVHIGEPVERDEGEASNG